MLSWQGLQALVQRLRAMRFSLSLAADAAMVVLAWQLTYLFRLGLDRWFSARPDYDARLLAVVVCVYLLALWGLRLPQSLWRFTGFGEVKRLALACLLAGGLIGLVVPALGLSKVPRAVLALHPFVCLVAMGMLRLAYRALHEHMASRLAARGEQRRALVLGAGAAARLLLAGIRAQGWQVLGLLDDDPAKRGIRIAGVPVVGPLQQLAEFALQGAATHIVVAMPGATPAQRRRALELAGQTGLPVLTVPSVDELRTGRSRIERLRDIEPEDLLGREPVALDEAPLRAVLAGRTVLVTGAGGSIGSELCRQLVRQGPARLLMLELSEFNLYSIEQELAQASPGVALVPLVGDVKDLAQLRQLMAQWRPQVVFHAAAYKHVPLMENHNAAAALRNNTLGTYHAALAAAEQGVERFVLVSTDKAVNPTNVMGASKRAAERVLTMLAQQYAGTRFMAVRFGNVLGSSGSVIPKFKEQIARGGPVTVTHPEVYRYFMTIPEAARLVLQAGAVGESGQVLVLDMGEPVRIADLARTLVRLAGHAPEEIEIRYVGLRPGEKLYEELLAHDDNAIPTSTPGLHVAVLGEDNAAAVAPLLALAASAEALDDERVRAELMRVVPEYRPAPAGDAVSATTDR